jgi:hypothetical protein
MLFSFIFEDITSSHALSILGIGSVLLSSTEGVLLVWQHLRIYSILYVQFQRKMFQTEIKLLEVASRQAVPAVRRGCA